MHLPRDDEETSWAKPITLGADEEVTRDAGLTDLLIPPAGATQTSRAIAGERPTLPSIRLVGVDIHAVSESQAIDFVMTELGAGRGGMVVTPNLDHLRRSVRHLSFAALVAEADLVVADGMPLIWASRLQGTPLPQRVAGSDLILSLSKAAAEHGRSIFMLGGQPGTAEGAGEVLKQRDPRTRIVGTYCPPMGFQHDNLEMARIVEMLAAAKPDIVYVALGSPKQEELIQQLRDTLPQAWWVGVGVSFSFLCGQVLRAPRWLQVLGLEWVHRLVQEPKRLAKRYLVEGVPFAAALMANAITNRLLRPVNGDGHRKSIRSNPSVDELPGEPSAASSDPDNIELPFRIRSPRPATHPAGSALPKLRAVVLLSGQLRPTPFTTGIDRSILDLPMLEGTTLLNLWLEHIAELAEFTHHPTLMAKLLVSRQLHTPTSCAPRYANLLHVERDASDFRGTGGVLRDLAQNYDDNDWLLVANAAQMLLEPLPVLAAALEHKRADVTLINHDDGSPSGVTLLRCETLRKINPLGFVDLKEQALPQIAENFDVRVLNCRRPTALPVRSSGDYIAALRRQMRQSERNLGGRRAVLDPLAEDTSEGFRIVEEGAIVSPSAYLHDAVVLRGARIEAGAVVVRSVVGPGAIVRRDHQLVNQFLNRNAVLTRNIA